MQRKPNAITLWVNTYLNSGIKSETEIEVARKITVLNLFAFVGFSITFLLGFRAVLAQEWGLGLSLFFAFALFLSSHLYLRFSASRVAYKISSVLLQMVLMILCLYLVYSGGTNNTGPLWIYLVPPVVMFFSGIRGGLLTIFGFVVAYCLVVFYPDNAIGSVEYSYEFKSRLLYSFLTLTFLAGFYEYSRQTSYQKLNELTKEFEKQATLDPLTLLFNRRGMLERIDDEVVRAQRNKTSLSFVIADVDYFKSFNDQYGHEVGDTVLVTLSNQLKDAVRKQDSVARWGGEEFLFLLPDTNLEQAAQLAEKIRKHIEATNLLFEGHHHHTTLSFGVAEVESIDNARDAILVADKRLYIAKDQGRNRVISSH